jgi:hypothetical protein
VSWAAKGYMSGGKGYELLQRRSDMSSSTGLDSGVGVSGQEGRIALRDGPRACSIKRAGKPTSFEESSKEWGALAQAEPLTF